jgi:hypothetical protein
MSWGEGVVVSVDDGDGSPCEGCGEPTDRGSVAHVRMTSFDDPPTITSALVCEACFEDLTSDLAGTPDPGLTFSILTDPIPNR